MGSSINCPEVYKYLSNIFNALYWHSGFESVINTTVSLKNYEYDFQFSLTSTNNCSNAYFLIFHTFECTRFIRGRGYDFTYALSWSGLKSILLYVFDTWWVLWHIGCFLWETYWLFIKRIVSIQWRISMWLFWVHTYLKYLINRLQLNLNLWIW